MTRCGQEKKGSERVACINHWTDEKVGPFRDQEFIIIMNRRKKQLMLQ